MITNYPSKKTVLIVNATSYFGNSLINEFAKNNFNIIAVAKCPDRLHFIKKSVAMKYSTHVETICKDLSEPNGAKQVYDLIINKGILVNVLVNDGGMATEPDQVMTNWEDYNKLLQSKTVTLSHLTYLYAKDMLARDEGKILHICSNITNVETSESILSKAINAFVISISKSMSANFKQLKSNVTITCFSSLNSRFAKEIEIDSNLISELPACDSLAHGVYHSLINGKHAHLPNKKLVMLNLLRSAIPKKI